MEPLAQLELKKLVEAAGESDHIDAKGPMKWDGQVRSARLAKAFAAFANSTDGGAIVIGKEERDPGKFTLSGLSRDEADSFETTKVATWVNNHFSPPIRLICHRLDHDGQEFVVITVSEFDDIPSICTKSFQDPNKPKEHTLRCGEVYVRTANAESRKVSTPDELRGLIGLATQKRSDQILAMFRATVAGKPLVPLRAQSDEYDSELVELEKDILDDHSPELGYWRMWFRPTSYTNNRWSSVPELEKLIQRTSVRVFSDFPHTRSGTVPREWGISNIASNGYWGLTHSGMFVSHRFLREDLSDFDDPMSPGGQLFPAGRWMDYQTQIFMVTDFFFFCQRFAHQLDPGEDVEVELRLDSLRGRSLVSLNPRIPFHTSEPSHAKHYVRLKRLSVEGLRADWQAEAAELLTDLFSRFPMVPPISHDVIENMIQRYLNRDV